MQSRSSYLLYILDSCILRTFWNQLNHCPSDVLIMFICSGQRWKLLQSSFSNDANHVNFHYNKLWWEKDKYFQHLISEFYMCSFSITILSKSQLVLLNLAKSPADPTGIVTIFSSLLFLLSSLLLPPFFLFLLAVWLIYNII